jgi:hypothetical protein
MRFNGLSVVLFFCCILTGCGGGNSGSQPSGPSITSVSVSPSSANVLVGATQQFSVSVNGTGSFSSQVTWSVNHVTGGNSTSGTITSGGLHTAPGVRPSTNAITTARACSSSLVSKSRCCEHTAPFCHQVLDVM